MLTPPPGLDLDALTAALTRHWGVAVTSAEYLPVGFGSHHWRITDPGGGAWFATVDDLEVRAGLGDLRRALACARALYDGGVTFVLAPIPSAGGELVITVGRRFAASLYPWVEGESFEFTDDRHPAAILEMVTAVHQAPAPPDAVVDDLGVPDRGFLEAAVAATGPYSAKVADLFAEHGDGVRAALARYDALAAAADRSRDVLTHGEPHPGNTLRTKDGWRLLDWDTARLAPPERDLWMLGADLTGYTAATGVVPDPALMDLFRLRWTLTDIAVETARFARPHTGDAEDAQGWAILAATVAEICP